MDRRWKGNVKISFSLTKLDKCATIFYIAIDTGNTTGWQHVVGYEEYLTKRL